MKYVKNLALVLLIALSGCLQEDGSSEAPLYYDFGILQEDGTSYTITVDNGGAVLAAESLPVDLEFEGKIRVTLAYSVISEGSEADDYDYLVTVRDIEEMNSKNILVIDDVSRDTIGDGGAEFHKVWITEDYLTVHFSFYAHNKEHKFNLTYDEQSQEDGNLLLEFKHLDNDDLATNLYTGYLSFRLNSLQEDGKNEITFNFKGQKYYNEEFVVKDLVYKY
jgi:hypothetical protein